MMRLERRLAKLETTARERWREEWQNYAERLRQGTPQAAGERLDAIVVLLRQDPEELERRWGDRQLSDVLGGVDLKGLDVDGLDDWFCRHKIPDPDHPDLSFTPRSILPPPLEPPGAWEALEPLLSDEGERGEAAAIALCCLAAARVVRECCGLGRVARRE